MDFLWFTSLDKLSIFIEDKLNDIAISETFLEEKLSCAETLRLALEVAQVLGPIRQAVRDDNNAAGERIELSGR